MRLHLALIWEFLMELILDRGIIIPRLIPFICNFIGIPVYMRRPFFVKLFQDRQSCIIVSGILKTLLMIMNYLTISNGFWKITASSIDSVSDINKIIIWFWLLNNGYWFPTSGIALSLVADFQVSPISSSPYKNVILVYPIEISKFL